MAERQPTRAELIARIMASSKDAVVLAEMQRLGFWPKDAGQPGIEAALIQREVELVQALDGLQADLRLHGDPQAALKAMRAERMAAAREKREATAQKREQQRHARALAWHWARDSQVGYLGQDVSAGLAGSPDVERLRKHRLPEIASPLALAQAMGITVPELRFLAFHREVARTTHYRRFALPKKSGGTRTISAPMPRLKRAQYWVLDNVLAKPPCHDAAHGFLPGRSIVSNAAPHAGQAVVINLDLKDFFPSIAFPRIKGVFRQLGYGEDVASVLALLCSENVCDELQVDGERFFVGGKGRERVLPQGAPTSPMLTNLLCRTLDRRLSGLARAMGFVYTRYADDLSFSASGDGAAQVGRLLRRVHHVLKDEGFTPHPQKQRVMRAGTRQEVTGIVVNDKPSVSRTQRRRLRAALHTAATKGIDAARWNDAPVGASVLTGFAQFVAMVDAKQGAPLLARARAIAFAMAGTLPNQPPNQSPAAARFRAASARGEAPPRAKGEWWQPAARPEPQLQLTAGQIKSARAERLRAERAQREAARHPERAASAARAASATNAADSPSTAAPSTPATPPITLAMWIQWVVQLLLMLRVSLGLHSALMMMLGVIWLGYSLMKRRFGWIRFLLALLALSLVAVTLRI